MSLSKFIRSCQKRFELHSESINIFGLIISSILRVIWNCGDLVDSRNFGKSSMTT